MSRSFLLMISKHLLSKAPPESSKPAIEDQLLSQGLGHFQPVSFSLCCSSVSYLDHVNGIAKCPDLAG